ncbi:unnamed protein product [Amoebophrya sp. A120]|nr:unnamed protein product [Amoebophrya sp. A120]|eukprot:GSA120T00019212001.1
MSSPDVPVSPGSTSSLPALDALGLSDSEIITLKAEQPDSNAECVISLHGAHVLSWTDKFGNELLYMSKRAKFDAAKNQALRGGIPICWPAFANKKPAIGKHGFVRTSKSWTVIDKSESYCKLQFSTIYHRCAHDATCDEKSFDMANDDSSSVLFRVEFLLKENALGIQLSVLNDHVEKPLPFSCCLHTYFKTNVLDHGVNGASLQVKGLNFASIYEKTRELGKEWKVEADAAAGANGHKQDETRTNASSCVVVSVDGKQEVERMFFVDKVENPLPTCETSLGDYWEYDLTDLFHEGKYRDKEQCAALWSIAEIPDAQRIILQPSGGAAANNEEQSNDVGTTTSSTPVKRAISDIL